MSLGVEYAWSPPVCSHCKVFGHSFEACTKRELTEDEVAKMNEINAQNAQKTNSEVNANDTWRTVSYKKVVSNGNTSNQGNSQFVNRGPYNTRSNAARGRGGFTGRSGYKNVQKGESSKSVDTQKDPMVNKNSAENAGFENVAKKNKANNKENVQKKNVGKQEVHTQNRYSTLFDADEDVSMVEEHEVRNSVEGGNVPSNNIDVLKNKILDLERKIVEGNRNIGSTANRKAKEVVAERISKTGQDGNVALPGLFDEMYRAELDRIKDSHIHLFFACAYSRRLWERLKAMAKLDDVSYVWGEVISGIINKSASNRIWSIIQRLVFRAAVYFIWQERNFRVFQKSSRDVEGLFSVIFDIVRLRLMGLKIIKVSTDVREAALIWNFPLSLCSEGSKQI
ncbi:RNA-directed DNA polymerase, eukaryota, Reverse transcriptase zinc-binding domain protein [Artemisia annua]|uniref:RNA-directed DNA polymerase, eukaryota, Reverse transcriptase zinc-binding domain protein n=1 Tax=Artemisia annua TaxID=35608 RepID=A0A2U1P2V2_ARTAN|nr:RNA-directed DNA polymerase, eukaryota, Reverse transcriptase zinc-binding domain protein [Artemisia annua]